MMLLGRERLTIGYCAGCERFDEKLQRIEHVWKEKLAGEDIYPSVHDKIIRTAGTCGVENRRRVDFFFLTGKEANANVLVECDEYSHSRIPVACEMVRLQQVCDQIISNTKQVKPLYVIRFNPYTTEYTEDELLRALVESIHKGLCLKKDALQDARGVILHEELIGYSLARTRAYAQAPQAKRIKI